jgi:hypothetical protein
MTQNARIWLIRGMIWLMLLAEFLVITGVIPAPQSALTWFWFAYVFGFYLLFFELGIFVTRRNAAYQAYFVVAGIFVALNIASDAIGGIFDLYNTIPIFDNILHATSLPFVMSATALGVGKILIEQYDLGRIRWFLPHFILSSAMLVMSFHELFELAVDLLTRSNVGTGATNIHDTSFDLLFDFIGVFVFMVGLAVYQRLVGRRVTPT